MLIHNGTVLAEDVTVARSVAAKARGWIGRTAVDRDEALVFLLDAASPTMVHMLGVRTALGVLWVRDGTVTATGRLPAWTGVGRAEADCIIETHPETVKGVAPGDSITVRP